MKQLILNADDFGMTRGVNEGIIRAHREGVLTSTTLMANGAEFEDAGLRANAHPKVMEALGRVAKELGITRIRKPMENLRDSWATTRHENSGRTKELIAAAAARAVTPWFQTIARKYNLLSPDYFLGLAMTGGLGPAALCRMIDTLSDGSTEIMLHPGVCDVALANSGSRLQDQRETELQGLLDPGVRSALVERDIRLISYRELH